jgi:hypothetical protein
MVEQILIDGNNLLHAMHAHAPLPAVGRETMVRVVDRWARGENVRVLIVYDGPTPPDGLARQMSTSRVDVRFSAPDSADDVIADLLRTVRRPAAVRVISSDSAVRREASRRRCGQTDCIRFIAELFPDSSNPENQTEGKNLSSRQSADDGSAGPADDKPGRVDAKQADEWMRWFGFDKEP